jgi:hypothetical protein
MGPIRNPNWSTSGMRVTLSYLNRMERSYWSIEISKNFLNDLKFILYLKYDNFSTTWCMTRLPWLPIIYVRAHYIIQLEIHKNTSYFSGNTDAAVNKKNNKITRKKYTRFLSSISRSYTNIACGGRYKY